MCVRIPASRGVLWSTKGRNRGSCALLMWRAGGLVCWQYIDADGRKECGDVQTSATYLVSTTTPSIFSDYIARQTLNWFGQRLPMNWWWSWSMATDLSMSASAPSTFLSSEMTSLVSCPSLAGNSTQVVYSTP